MNNYRAYDHLPWLFTQNSSLQQDTECEEIVPRPHRCWGSVLAASQHRVLNLTPLLIDVLFLMKGTAAFLNVQLIAWFQQLMERAMMGRVMSVLMFASVGLMPFSLAIQGVALKWSLPGTFVVAGVMVLLVVLLATAHQPIRAID